VPCQHWPKLNIHSRQTSQLRTKLPTLGPFSLFNLRVEVRLPVAISPSIACPTTCTARAAWLAECIYHVSIFSWFCAVQWRPTGCAPIAQRNFDAKTTWAILWLCKTLHRTTPGPSSITLAAPEPHRSEHCATEVAEDSTLGPPANELKPERQQSPACEVRILGHARPSLASHPRFVGRGEEPAMSSGLSVYCVLCMIVVGSVPHALRAIKSQRRRLVAPG
jgi:hypothetical protein